MYTSALVEFLFCSSYNNISLLFKAIPYKSPPHASRQLPDTSTIFSIPYSPKYPSPHSLYKLKSNNNNLTNILHSLLYHTHRPYIISTKMQYEMETRGYYSPMKRTSTISIDPLERVVRLASNNAVVIFSISSCCMCHAVKRLFNGMGVNPTVYELDQDPRGKEMERALIRVLVSSQVVPVVFIGGKLVGSMDRVMASHINGSLVPLLKEAGALWL